MAMTLRLTAEQDAKLEEICADRNLSKQQAVAALIEEADAKAMRTIQMRNVFDKVMTRDAELMRRLADA
ncbi:MAG: hypothetical protein RJB56_1126 [Actinomycetota bacterium]|jgi:uncharacterized protein YaiL (DUF2058 family)